MDQETLLLVVAALSLAGFMQGLTGFGFGMTAMGLLPLVIDVEQAQGIVTVASVAACVLMTGITLAHVQWAAVRGLLYGSVGGVVLGFAFLESLPRDAVTRVMGGALCLMVLFDVFVRDRQSRRLPSWTGVPVGLASGVLTGAFNIGGPPLVAYLYGRPWTKEQHVATISAVFLTGGAVRLTLLLLRNEITAAGWVAAGWAVVPMLAAVALGTRLLRRVPQPVLRWGVMLLLLGLGVKYLLAP